MTLETPDASRGLSAPLFGVAALQSGISGGFVSVTLGYVLTHRGFSVPQVAGLVGLSLLPGAWKFLIGPIIDVSLTPRAWYLGMVGLLTLAMLGVAVTPLAPASMPLLSVLAFLIGATSNAASSAKTAVVIHTVPPGGRGAVAGWSQAANLGGTGVGGGAGLWIATQLGAPTASAVLAGVIVLCAAPMFWVRTPPVVAGRGVTSQMIGLATAMWALARSRDGVLAIVAVVLPVSLGAAGNLLPAVAGDWRASANLVALATGLLGGLAAVPGCLAGGYLCARYPPRTVYMAAGAACGLGEAAMALAPHSPAMFLGFVLFNNLLLGVAWAGVSAVTYEVLQPAGAATVGAVMASLTNLPVVVTVMLIGAVHARQGATAMLLAEAGLAGLSLLAYGLLAWLWRPAPDAQALAPA